MRRATFTTVLAFMVASAALIAWPPRETAAQQPAPILGVEITMARQRLSVGDRVLMTLRLRHRADVAVTASPEPPAGVDFGKPTVTTLALPDGVVQTTVTWTVQPFLVGRVGLAAFPVAWVTQDGHAGRFQVKPPEFEVVPLRAPGDDGLRPLKDPLPIAGGPPAWLRPLLIAIAAAAVLSFVALLGGFAVRQVRRWWPRRAGPSVMAPAVEPVTAESSARGSLDDLAGVLLNTPAAFEAYYGTIALVVRRYLSDRVGFNAYALTTDELEQRMTASGVDRWQARLVGGLLERCDAAVYAHRFPDPTSADHDLTVAYEIVELSRPGAPPTGVVPRGVTA